MARKLWGAVALSAGLSGALGAVIGAGGGIEVGPPLAGLFIVVGLAVGLPLLLIQPKTAEA